MDINAVSIAEKCSWRRNDGHGTFNLTSSIVVSNVGNGPAVVGDFNADGRLDLATINDVNVGTVSILLQEPAPRSFKHGDRSVHQCTA